MNYSTYTNEELVSIIAAGDDAAYEQLFRNLAPITLHEAEMYRGKMDTYSTEDFLQEGNIVAWEIISRGNFKGGKFSTYFGGAIRKRLMLIWVLTRWASFYLLLLSVISHFPQLP